MTYTMTVLVHHSNLISANGRAHWRVKAQATAVLRTVGALEARRQRVPRMEAADLRVLVSWPTRHHRDVENLAPTLKALVDGIVQDSHVLPDDDDLHLTGPDKRVTDELSGRPGVTRLVFEFTPRPVRQLTPTTERTQST